MNDSFRRSHPLAAGLGLLLLCSSLAAPASAQSAVAVAAEHAKKADVAYSLQDWKTAIAEYQAAYRSDQRLEYLWGLAQSQRLNEDYVAAIRSYKVFARSGASPQQVAIAEAQIAKCEAALVKRDVEGKAKGQSPKAEPTAPAGLTTPTTPEPSTATPTAPTPPPPAPDVPVRWYADPLGHVLTIGGIGLFTVGSVMLAKGNSDAGDTTGTRDEVVQRHDSARVKQIIGGAGLATGGALLVNGVVRYLLVEKRRTLLLSPSRPQAALAVSPQGAALFVTAEF